MVYWSLLCMVPTDRTGGSKLLEREREKEETCVNIKTLVPVEWDIRKIR